MANAVTAEPEATIPVRCGILSRSRSKEAFVASTRLRVRPSTTMDSVKDAT